MRSNERTAGHPAITDEAAQFPAQFAADGVSDVLDVDGALALLSVSALTVRKLAGAGKIPARKVGSAWRFHRPTLLQWLEGDAVAVAPDKPQELRGAPVAHLPPSRLAAPFLATARPGSRDLLASRRSDKTQERRERQQR